MLKRAVMIAAPIVAAAALGAGANPFALLEREARFQQQGRFQVPAGFAVEELLDHDQVGPVVAITFDAEGRMVIAKEFGEIVTLIPQAGGGYEQRVFTDQIANSQGLNFDGPDLLVVAVGPQGTGLYRAVDENGDARADRIEIIENANRRIEDHGPHAPVWGPDGLLYWVHANTSGIYSDASPLSPVRKFDDASLLQRASNFYRLPAGKIFRKDVARHAGPPQTTAASAGGDWELYSSGHRNAYDVDFNLLGEAFLNDSDHEPELAQPWYRETRSVQVLPGGQYGYREGSGVHPFYYFDDAPTLELMQRGSPTGVTAYQAYAYPAEYRDMVLFADWSRGRVIGTRLVKSGAGYTPQSSNFIFGTPLNVADIAVGPDGNVYFVLGGRYSAGGVYRVVYRGQNAAPAPEARTPVERVLTAIQPRSAYSRKLASDTRAQVGERNWSSQLVAVARDARRPAEQRVRALELLQVFGPAPEESLLVSLSSDPAWELRAAAVYYLGMKTTEGAQRALVAKLKDADAFVQRRAAEALLRTGLNPANSARAPISAVSDVFPLLGSQDPYLRYSARTLLRELNPNSWREEMYRLTEMRAATSALLAYVQAVEDDHDRYNFARFLNRQRELFASNPGEAELLDLVRLMQYSMTKDAGVRTYPAFPSAARVRGGVVYLPGRGFFNVDTVTVVTTTSLPANAQSAGGGGGGGGAGGAPAQPMGVYPQIGSLLLQRFPASDWRLNREIARVLAYLQTPGAIPELLAELEKPTNDAKQQMHMADMLSRFEQGWDAPLAERMTAWYEKAARERLNVTAFRNDFVAKLPEAERAPTLARIQAATPAVAQVPGGGQAAGPMTEEQIDALIFNPQNTVGTNPAVGAVAYQKAACVVCHIFGPIGTQVGPDLTTVAQRFNRRDLVRAIAYPHEQINPQYEATTITRTNGETVTGIVTQETGANVILLMAGGVEVGVPTAEIRSRARSERSLMPDGLMNTLSGAERNSLVALLLTGPAALPDTTVARIQRR